MTAPWVFAILAPVAIAGAPYRYSRPIEAPVGWATLAVPDDVLDASQAGLPDLRIVGPGGEEVAYTFGGTSPRTAPLGLVDVERAPGRETTAVVERGAEAWPASSLVLDVVDDEFLKPLVVESSDDRANWREFARGAIFATRGVAMTELRFSPNSRRFWRLRFDDRNGPPITPRAVVVPRPAPEVPAPRLLPLELSEQGADEGQVQRFEAALPVANLSAVSIAFEATDPAFSREARVYERVLVRDEVSRRLLGAATLVRVPAGASSLSLPLGAPAGKQLEIEVERAGALPIKLTRAVVTTLPRQLTFYAPAPGGLELRYGAPGARPPRYDLDAVFARGRPASTASAHLGAVTDHGDSRAPLPTVARGARLESTRWKTKRPIVLPEVGAVAYLELAERAASALGDVRIVDGEQRQVPYVVERDLHRVRRPVPLELAEQGRVTRVKLALGDARSTLEAVELTVSGPAFFARTVSVVEEQRDVRGVRGEAVLGSARWERTLDGGAATVRIPVERPSDDTVFVRIDNGDNAPLRLSGAALGLARARIDFLFSPGDELALLVDNPAASPPTYDLALLADAIRLLPARRADLAAAEHVVVAGRATPYGFWAAVVVAGGLILVALSRALKVNAG